MTPRFKRLQRHAAACALLAALAACGDRPNPVGPDGSKPGAPGTPGRPVTLQALDCTGNRETGVVQCAPAAPATAAAANITVGYQNVYVTLTSSNPSYNSGTGRFTFDVTVRNLIEQKMGTTDGTTLDAGGVRVFFHTGPTTTSGSGSVSAVPDGFGNFTGSGQPYYQYNQILANGQTSAARQWTLIMPPSVNTFAFTLFVSAPVQFPDGYVTLNGQLPGYDAGPLSPSAMPTLTAVVKDALGNVVAGEPVVFGTTDPTRATVDAGGTVDPIRAGPVTITANSGIRPGSIDFDVTGAIRLWDGSASTDWSDAANWSDNVVPADVDTATIPVGVPNFPALTAATGIGGVSVADGATLSLGAFNLTASASVATGATAGSGILGTTGELILAGAAGTVGGRVPSVRVTGTYSLSANLFAVAPGTVDLGSLTSEQFELQIVSQ